nr:excalibur calcium-binding domain-containing protein [Angustibacter aerolatus]
MRRSARGRSTSTPCCSSARTTTRWPAPTSTPPSLDSTDPDGTEHSDGVSASLRLVQATGRVQAKVSKHRVKAGGSVSVSGVVSRKAYRATHFAAAPDRTVQVQFRRSGTTTYKTVATVRADAKGRFTKAVKVTASGRWRARIGATEATRAATSPSVLVTATGRVATKAKPTPKRYANCAALNRVYPHGVGRSGARDHTSGTPVTSFTRDSAAYRLNTGRDRDHDGIACERR